jgi:hypothetical protein
MKTKTIVGTLVSLVLIVAAFFVGQRYYGSFPWDKEKPLTEAAIDSIVQKSVTEMLNPTFDVVDDVIAYRVMSEDIKQTDSVFNYLPDATVEYVSNVLFNRKEPLNKKSIVHEYQINRNVYDNLPLPPVADTQKNQNTSTSEPLASIELTTEGKTTVTEAPQTRVGNVTISTKDTTIDGKAAVITTNVEKKE